MANFRKTVIALAPSFMDRFCCSFTQMFSMKNILIKFKFQLSRAKVNVKEAILRNILFAVRCFHLWTDFDITSYGRRLCSNWFRYGSTTISFPQCSLTFMHERCLHKCLERSFSIRAYVISAAGIDVVRVHMLFAYRTVSTVSTDIVSSHTKYCRIAYGITR